MNFSEGEDSKAGRWAKGPAPDGMGEFDYVKSPKTHGEEPVPSDGDPHLWGTPKQRS